MNPSWYYARGESGEQKTVKFYKNDTEREYNKNLSEKRDVLEENGWIPLPDDERCVGYRYLFNPSDPVIDDWVELSYNINSHGFRSEEMPTEKKPRSIITVGCSMTFGLGMPIGQIWPTIVGNTLRQRPYNLGVPAGSLDTAFRVLFAWLPKIRPSHVFLLVPPGVRYETHTHSFGISNSVVDNMVPVAMRFEHEDEWILHREKTMRAIQSLCDQFETPLTWLDSDIIDNTHEIGRYDVARNLTHPGRNCHIWIAMNMLKKAGYEWNINKK